jgi:SAM-dependent methyltransferase
VTPRRAGTKRRKPAPRVSEIVRSEWNRAYEKRGYENLPWFSATPTPWVVRAVREGWLPRGEKVLDIGCGAGTNLLWFAKSGFPTYGVDLAPSALAAARSRAAEAGVTLTLREGDATDLPFAGRQFGAALDAGCFHTLPRRLRPAYARELARVVRPGGTVLLIWVGREETREGPPHRPSLSEVTQLFEKDFIFRATEFHPSDTPGGWAVPHGGRLAIYTSRLERRRRPQPPPR